MRRGVQSIGKKKLSNHNNSTTIRIRILYYKYTRVMLYLYYRTTGSLSRITIARGDANGITGGKRAKFDALVHAGLKVTSTVKVHL